MFARCLTLAAAALAALSAPVAADWPATGNTPTLLGESSLPGTVVSDGAGGVILVVASRPYFTAVYNIRAQRFDAYGNRMWGDGGVGVTTNASITQVPRGVVSDGEGGVIITWADNTLGAYDVYAQRLDPSGLELWTPGGVAVTDTLGDQDDPVCASDGMGGAIIAWHDTRADVGDIYAQRVDAAGVPQWTSNGVALVAFAGLQADPDMVTNTAGGAFVAWTDDVTLTDADIYANIVSFAGGVAAGNGFPVAPELNDQRLPAVAQDGAGGAFVVWIDERGSDADIYGQHLDGSGVAGWTSGGQPICTAGGIQDVPDVVYDGAGGCIAGWRDNRDANYDVYAQRVSAYGAYQWPSSAGLAATASPNSNGRFSMSPSGDGGAYFIFEDAGDIGGQFIAGDGATPWGAGGVTVSNLSPNDETLFGQAVFADPAGGVYFMWRDSDRTPDNADLTLLTRVDGDHGEYGHPEPRVDSVADNPDDQGGSVLVNWSASDRDRLSESLITHYSVWRATDQLPAMTYAVDSDVVTDPAEIGRDFSGIAYYVHATAAGESYWEFVANQDATYQAGYSLNTATRQDSVGGNTNQHYFMVLAHTSDPFVFFESNPDSGYSVDNLSPGTPLMLTALRVGDDVELSWSPSVALDPDLKEYAVYRSDMSGVTPDPLFYVTSNADTMLTDVNAPGSVLYYVVTAVDVHLNESGPSNEAMAKAVPTAAGDRTPALTSLQAQPNVPNPFSATTELRIGLPAQANVRVDVFDVAGRRVATRDVGRRSAGWQSIRFDGRDNAGRPLPSGVYFYRITAGSERVTRKMVLHR